VSIDMYLCLGSGHGYTGSENGKVRSSNTIVLVCSSATVNYGFDVE
jgi:hypothetical protein